ncbi:MAG: hypothetical protein ABL898_16870 [Hyphomicrobiaceae bacterium]
MKKFENIAGRALKSSLPILAALALTACAQDGTGLISTGTLGSQAAVTETKAPVDPQCLTLATEIDTLKNEGSTARLEKVADGKSGTVSVKRASLAKQAQLNKANADFITKCGPNLPRTAAVAPQAAPVDAAPIQAAAAGKAMTAVKAKTAAVAQGAATSGVTVVPPTAAVTVPAAASAAKPQ